MTDAPRLLLVAHGTRSAAGRRTVERLRDGVAGRLPGVDVALSWVDLLEPRPQDVLDDGVTTVVVPCFLAAGYHVRTDVAAAVTAARGVAVGTGHLGDEPEVAEALLHRLLELPGADAVVLAAAGSSDERSLAETRRLARRLSTLLSLPVVAAFATAAAPSVSEAVAGLRAGGSRRIAVASHLLAPGVFADRVAAAGADLVSEPLGAAEPLQDLLVRRYVEGVQSLSSRRR